MVSLEARKLEDLLAGNPYPGRGILLGRSACGRRGVMAYFIMGRSENSRNRVFVRDGDGIATRPANPALVQDPSLIIYSAVRRSGEASIVTNGEQTDTIWEALEAGGSFEAALRGRTFEPDAPHYTSRISGLIALGLGGFSYKLSIIKRAPGGGAQRFFFEYPEPAAGQGHFISTYAGPGEPLPAFSGEPVCVALPDGIDALGRAMWQSLNDENKVSLFVRTLPMHGAEETRIYNKYER